MQLLEGFIRNPVKVAVGVLLVALFGFISLGRMPIQLTPEVQIPTLTITTIWPGASPQEVERQIVQEQEEQLKGVEGMRKMTSDSADSSGTLTLEFDVGTDMNEALVRVNTRLQQVREYPEEADEPVISTSNSSDRPIAWFILRPRVPGPEAVAEVQQKHPELAEALEPARKAHNSGLRVQRLKMLLAERPDLQPVLQKLLPEDLNISGMRRFAEDYVEAEFERVTGVSQANVLGGREEEMQLILDPERLAARQLTIVDVRAALRGENVDTSGGDLWEGKRRWVVRTLGQFRSPEQVENALLARRDGSPVYVRDVGEVRLGYKKPSGLVRNFGLEGLAVNAMRATGANVLDVMEGLRITNQKLNEGILKQRGLQLEQVYDETEYIHSAIGLVQDNIVVGGILTVIVLIVFLRSGRSTLVISLSIPTSIIGTFLLMDLMGRSLNVISLAGLAFAVGMLVDNSIVVLENIFRRYQLGEDAMTASIRGAQEVWGAVVASTLTTLAVFLPVLFVQEEAGQLFRDIALAVSAGVGLSLIVSITVIPVATARILSHEVVETHNNWLDRLLRPVDAVAHAFVRGVLGFNLLLQRSLKLQVITVAGLMVVSIVLTWALIPGREYLPNGNRNLVIGILLPPPGYNIDRLTEMGEQLEGRLKPYWNVDPGSPEIEQLEYPAISDYFYVAANQQVFFGLRAQDPLRAGELVPLIRQMASSEPGTFAAVFQSSLFEGGLTAGRTVDVEITGPDLTKLVALGGRILGQVTQQVLKDPQTQAIPKPSLDLSSPELHVVPKWEQAADMGITAADLGYTVNALVDGAKATDYYLGGDKIDLSIVGNTELARRTQDLEQLSIATPTGDLVSLGSVAKIDYGSGPEKISHRESQRAITISVTPPPHVPVQEAVERIQREIIDPLAQSGELGGEYQITLSGTADKLQQTWRALSFNVVLALLITYLLMAALFESWLYPFVIILSVPWGAVGGFLGLAILNLASFTLGGKYEPLDVLAMLGFVILIGTVVNNPILIVHQSLNHMREDGMTRDAAVIESVRNRIRPIFMTTATTILGLLPLVLFVGAGSELYRGLGSVLLGGLLVSTLFTLVFVPTLFTLTLETKAWVLRQFGWSSAAATETKSPAPVLESSHTAEHRSSIAGTNGNSGHHGAADPRSSSGVPPGRELS